MDAQPSSIGRLRWLLLLVLLLLPIQARASELEFKGIVLSRPSTGVIGAWNIGNTTFQVTAQTAFPKGTPSVGTCVEVKYNLVNSQNVARYIEPSDDCSGRGERLEAKGIITARPVGSLFGAWQIGGAEYQARAGTTSFKEEYGQLAVGQCAEVKYVLEGSTRVAAELESKQPYECRGEQEHSKAYGVITSLPGTPDLVGPWVIGGQTYQVTRSTKLEDGPFTTGLLVEVEFVAAADGTLTAISIEGKRSVSDDDRRHAKAYGRINALPDTPDRTGVWTIADLSYTVQSSTRLKQEDGPFAVGACVEVTYHIDASNTRSATKIETTSGDDCTSAPGGEPYSRTYGFVQQMPSTGLVGTWLIGGVSFVAGTTTRFEQERGALAVGAYVEVYFTTQGGVNNAAKIETHVPPGGGRIHSIGGLRVGTTQAAAAQPATTQTWYVDNQPYTILAATVLDDRQGALVDGQTVVVNAYTDTGGNRVATRIAAVQMSPRAYLPLAIRQKQ